MKILIAAYYEFMKNMRDIKMLACLLIFPIVITYMLGNALGGYLSTDIEDKIPVGYINQDNGVIGKEFDTFLKSTEIQKRLIITTFKNDTEARIAADTGKVDAVISIPAGLSEKLMKGNKASIDLYGKKNIEFIETLARSFISSYNAVNSIISLGEKPLHADTQSSITKINYTKDSKMPQIIDYYAVLELLNVLILGGVFGILIVTKSQNSDMHIRTHALPTSKFTLTSGRILGSSMFLTVISLVIIAFTKYVFHVNWNGNILIIMGTMFLFSLISVGIGVLTGTLIPGFSTSLMIVLLLMMTFGIVSGAISPSVANGFIGMLTPNYHAKILILGTIYGYQKGIMLESVAWLLCFITVIYGLSAIVTRRRSYDNI